MNVQESASKFRNDRRLQLRRGWIAPDQVDKDLEGLPDVSDKGELVESPQHKGEPAPESAAK